MRDEKREKMGNDYRKGSDILVKLKNGKVLNKIVDFPLGSDRRPLTSEQMAKKFRRLAAKVLPKRKVSQIEKLVWDLENVPSVTPLIKALRKR